MHARISKLAPYVPQQCICSLAKVVGNPGGYDHNMVLFNLTEATARERVNDCQVQPR